MTLRFQKNFLSVTLKNLAEDDSLSLKNAEKKAPPEGGAWKDYSTVTDFARLRGWSTSVPLISAT